MKIILLVVGPLVIADRASIRTNLEPDADFWQACAREWKRADDYRDRVNRHNAEWFEGDTGRAAESFQGEDWLPACVAWLAPSNGRPDGAGRGALVSLRHVGGDGAAGEATH